MYFEHISYGKTAQVISGIVLIADIELLPYLVFNMGGMSGDGIKTDNSMLKYAFGIIILVVVGNLFKLFYDATKSTGDVAMEAPPTDRIILSSAILLPLLVSTFFMYKESYSSIDRRYVYPISITFLVIISGLIKPWTIRRI